MRPTAARSFAACHGWRLAACLAATAVFLQPFRFPVTNQDLRGPQTGDGLTPVCALQGRGFRSPFEGQAVRTGGVVTLDLDETSKKGFFLQAPDCDNDPSTSDGLFVYLAVRGQSVDAGDRVEVSGVVQEYYGMTELRADSTGVNLIAKAQPLPLPVDTSPPFDLKEADRYFERLEGMSVQLDDSRVVGPTDIDSRTWVVRASLGIERVFQGDPAGTGEIVCIDAGGLYAVAPQPKTGDRITGLSGVLDFTAGRYCLQLAVPPAVFPALDPSSSHIEFPSRKMGSQGAPASFSIATFNLADLFDTQDDPLKQDTVLSAAEYQRRLEKRALAIHEALGEPEILAVQEVENRAVLDALLARPEIEARYQVIMIEGPDERGIDVALLLRTDRVRAQDIRVRQGCTQLFDGFGPDGNRDPLNPQNAITCDSDGDGDMDGNRLFSRPPLLARLEICRGACEIANERIDLWVIANHFKSKVEDSDTLQYTATRREQEARFVAGLAGEILADRGASLVVLGDLNDFPTSQPLAVLNDTGLRDLWPFVPQQERYSYIYQGISQVLDYVLVYLQPPLSVTGVSVPHINSDYPATFNRVGGSFFRSSDHDLLLARVGWMDSLNYLPLIGR